MSENAIELLHRAIDHPDHPSEAIAKTPASAPCTTAQTSKVSSKSKLQEISRRHPRQGGDPWFIQRIARIPPVTPRTT